ncbi:MAG: hypothetical protein AAF206_16280, partial [Bacteroidota bacterium]
MKPHLFTFILLNLLLNGYIVAQNQASSKQLSYPQMIHLSPSEQQQSAGEILQNYFELTPEDELRPTTVKQDQLGFTHERFHQYYKGIKVEGGRYNLHWKDGQLSHMNGNFLDVRRTDVKARIGEQAAFQAALDHIGATEYLWQQAVPDYPEAAREYQIPTGELVILPEGPKQEGPRLAWKFDIYATRPMSRNFVFVDGLDGTILRKATRLRHINHPSVGVSVYNDTVNFTAYDDTVHYRLYREANGNVIETLDLNGGTVFANATDITSLTDTFFSDPEAVQAHWGVEQAYNYFYLEQGRNSYNDSASTLRSY